MKKLHLLLIMCIISLCAGAQSRTVSGIVMGVDGEPLIGATVTPEGNGPAVITNADGEFSVSLPMAIKSIKVTYVGYMPAVEVITGEYMTINLKEDENKLDEVMVVAFGTAKKSAFTGSAAVLNAEELSRHVTTNVASSLAGAVPGLQIRGGSGIPGSGAGDINIRGISSLYASTSPLIIVDGAPYEENLNNIPQNDIESVSVLKDAASAALYGARGAAGVIIITTKKGNKSGTKISFDAKWGANSRAVQEYDIIKDPGLYYEAYYRQVNDFYTNVGGMDAATANIMSNNQVLSDLAYSVYSLPAGESLIGLDGRLNPNASLGNRITYNGKEYYLTPDDWTDLAYRSGFRQEYNVSINGGTDRASYYSSFNILDEDGVVEHSGYKRISARVKVDFQANKWLKLGANIGYTNSKTTSTPNLSNSANGGNIMYFTSTLAPIYPAYVYEYNGGNISVAKDKYGHPAYDYGMGTSGYGITRPFATSENPLGNNVYDKNTRMNNLLNGTFTVDINITPFLKFNATSSLTWSGLETSSYANPFYGSSVNTNGALTKSDVTGISTNNVQTITFFKDFGPHYVNVMAGHEYYYTTSRGLNGSAYGGFSPDILELSAFATPTSVGSSTSKYNVEGWFLNGQYNFDERYFLSASYRRDASSHFMKKYRWGNFWSVGGAWIISREKFMRNVDWVNMLKFKMSIGQQGNDNIGSYSYADLYTLRASSDGMSMVPTFSQLGNSDITWETTTNFNTGIEWSMFDNRFTGSFDVYTKKTTDLLFYLTVPRSTGAGGYYDNIGDIRNTGVELTLGGSIIRTSDYEWKVNFNMAHNKGKLLKLPASKMGNRGGFYNNNRWYCEGGPMYNYMCVAYAGVNEQGQALYYQDTDLLSESGSMDQSRPGTKRDATTTVASKATLYTMGSTLPKVFGGFSTSLRIKWFDVSATFDYQLGGKVFDSRYQSLMTPTKSPGDAGRNFHKDIYKAWTPENPTSDIPHWQYLDENAAAACDRFLTSARYLNFQSFTVGFTLPSRLIRDVAKVRVYATGENLCFWSARKGLDPRYSYAGNTNVPAFSPVRTVMGGLQVTF